MLYIRGVSERDRERKAAKQGWTIAVGSNGNRARIGNCVYIERDTEYLQELIEGKKDLNADIEQILRDLEKLYGDVEQVGLMPQRMGFEDRGRFDLFLDIKHATGEAFDETKARQFVDVLVVGLKKGLYAGWQESDQECRRVETDIKALADGDDFASLSISDNANLVETLVKRLVQHYGIE